MDFNNITLGQVAVAIATIGAICGFLFKVFTLFSQVKENKKKLEELEKELENFKYDNDEQKKDILAKVEETNTAVNLLCSAISAMIDNELNDNKNKDELRAIKRKLDEKKEIV